LTSPSLMSTHQGVIPIIIDTNTTEHAESLFF
jgi:hypothetical protein